MKSRNVCEGPKSDQTSVNSLQRSRRRLFLSAYRSISSGSISVSDLPTFSSFLCCSSRSDISALILCIRCSSMILSILVGSVLRIVWMLYNTAHNNASTPLMGHVRRWRMPEKQEPPSWRAWTGGALIAAALLAAGIAGYFYFFTLQNRYFP